MEARFRSFRSFASAAELLAQDGADADLAL